MARKNPELAELEFLVEYQEKLTEFHEAKKAAKSSKDPSSDERWRAAKEDLRAFRAYWRGIRDAVGAQLADGDAVATPAVHGVTLKGN